jgi:hypothetical protein
MHGRKRMFVALAAMSAASVALVLTPAGSAREMKVAATQSTYADATGDAKSAPDVAKVDVSVDGTVLAIEIGFAGPEDLANDGLAAVAFNTDRNSATGDQAGSDYMVVVGSNGYGFLKWNGSEMVPFSHLPTALARAAGKLLILLCTCDLGTETFDFAVIGVRGNDIDIAPDDGGTFPLQENPVAIESLLYSPTPLFPKAGKRFTIKVGGVRLEGTNEVVLPDTVSCSAKLAGKALKGSGCSWQLPKKARGKKLTVSVNVTYHGDSETFSQTFKVR